MFSRKNLIRLLINSLIGLVLIILWSKLVNISEVLENLKKVNLLKLFPFIIFFIASSLLRAIRLRLILSDYEISYKNLSLLTFLGQLLSFTVPLRLGELAKGVYLSTEYKLNFGKALIWILFDRFVDFWCVVVGVLVLLIFIPAQLPENFKPTLIVLVALISTITGVTIFKPDIIRGLFRFFVKFLGFSSLKKLFTQSGEFLIDGAGILNERSSFASQKKGVPKILLCIPLTILALISDAFQWYSVLLVVFDTPLPFPKVFLGSLFSMLTYLIPAAPGYVGSAEAGGLAVFSYILGFDKTLISVSAVLVHLLTLGCVLVTGILALYLLKFDLGLISRKLRK
jgi:uncharacterized membrane protein YbhN (UPF0104 family)